MPSLSDKLKNLGVKVGTSQVVPPPPDQRPTAQAKLEETLGGRWLPTRAGDTFVVESVFESAYQHGLYPMLMEHPMDILAEVCRDHRIGNLGLEELAFLDTETSGLSGGTGTYAFMVGIGRYIAGQFRLSIFFMQDPADEPAMLEAIADALAPCKAFVTFNGKSFDIPLLRTRYILNAIPLPFIDFSHIDLLHISRRLWRDRLPSRALKYLEEAIMEVGRTSEEVPGFEIPWLYFDYLRTGDAQPLKGVFYHNSMDVVSMAVLFNLVNWILQEPHGEGLYHGQDIIALARIFEELKRWDEAARLYERGLAESLPEADFSQAVQRLSILQKKRGDYQTAVRLWQQAADTGHIYAFVELAKYYEHKARDRQAALMWATRCQDLLPTCQLPAWQITFWRQEIEKRVTRLQDPK